MPVVVSIIINCNGGAGVRVVRAEKWGEGLINALVFWH